MDRPWVLAALGRSPDGDWRVVLGGHGPKPIRVPASEEALAQGDEAGAARRAEEAYASAADAWASAEYRAHVVGVLVRRLAKDAVPREPRDKA